MCTFVHIKTSLAQMQHYVIFYNNLHAQRNGRLNNLISGQCVKRDFIHTVQNAVKYFRLFKIKHSRNRS